MKPDLSPYEHLPRFDDGRINFHDSDEALGVNCLVTFKDEILLLKRSMEVTGGQGQWGLVGGHVDEPKTVEEKAKEEILEETGIPENAIQSLEVREPFTFMGFKKWVTYPAHAILTEKPEVVLDFEHTAYAWVTREELSKFNLAAGVPEVLEEFLEVQGLKAGDPLLS